MASEMFQTAQATGITYRSDDDRVVIVLTGDNAKIRISDGMGWADEADMSIESAWCAIARRGLKLVTNISRKEG